MVLDTLSTAILIDNMYLENAANSFGIGRLDIRKLAKVLLRTPPEELFRIYIFDALPYIPQQNASADQIGRQKRKQGYLDAIQYYERVSVELGDVRPKHTRCFKCQNEFNVPVQKLVDVKISVRLTTLAWANTVNKIILVSGDKDLLPAVEAAAPTKTIVRLAYFEEGNVQTAKALIRSAPEKQKLSRSDLAYCKFEGAN